MIAIQATAFVAIFVTIFVTIFVSTGFQPIPPRRSATRSGPAIAQLMITLWLGSLIALLALGPTQGPLLGLGILGRTMLQTGLFITGHDAMHGTVCPDQPSVNQRIGRVALYLYAFLAYDACRQRHHAHHHHPAQAEDPDFDLGQQLGPWFWRFMRNYLAAGQGSRIMGGIVAIFSLALAIVPNTVPRLFWFWLLPLVLSLGQLFYFGIYRPHKEPRDGWTDRHRATSLDVPNWLSFLLCYHFSYHWEHHEYPQLPWYYLPRVRQHMARRQSDHEYLENEPGIRYPGT
jgi:beta-carotene/zeaxanthin 4-ketolase